jgi:hypothetical protein
MKKAIITLAAIAIATAGAFAKPKLLTLSKELATGVTVTTWRVNEITISFDNDSADVHLSGYLSEEAMNAGKEPIEHQRIRVQGVNSDSDVKKVCDKLVESLISGELAGSGATAKEDK